MMSLEHFSGNNEMSKNLYVQIIDQINEKCPNRKNKNQAKSRKCSKCNYVAQNQSNLRNHLKIHRRGKSDKCGSISLNTSGLKQQLKTHGGQKPNKCNQCDYTSPYASHLRIHLKTHTGEKSNKCNQCD